MITKEQKQKKRALIIGAGLGGLSAAIRLAHRGWDVRVFEKESHPGGKAGSEWLGPYRFDTGPSLLTMPFVFDQLFEEIGRRREDYLNFIRLDPITRYFFADGTVVDGFADIDQFAQELHDKLGEEPSKVISYFKHAKNIWSTTHTLFLEQSLHKASSYLSTEFFKNLFKLGHIDAFRSLDEAHRTWFNDARTVQLFNRFASYNGSSPYLAPATLAIIPSIEWHGGGYGVDGGIYAISEALMRVAIELGVSFHFGKEVQKILTKDSVVEGIKVAGEVYQADAVISNTDVRNTYGNLLEDETSRDYKKHQEGQLSSSGLVYYWGVNKNNRSMLVNNVFFSEDYPAEFKAIFDDGQVPDKPTVFVNISSKVNLSDAPPGHENWFVSINAPCDNGQDWKTESHKTSQWIQEQLARKLNFDLQNAIKQQACLTPADIWRKTGSYRGSLYGTSSISRTAAFARHPNQSRDYKGLYFCGGSVHPGGGMPLVVLSGKICADMIEKIK